MIFWVFVVLTIVFAVMEVKEIMDLEVVWTLFGAICGLLSLIMLFIIICNNAGTGGMIALHQERYKALTYKVESENSRDNLGLLNKDYVDEIQSWNEDLAKNKSLQRDFWLGVFYPNIYDDFETIDLDNVVYKK